MGIGWNRQVTKKGRRKSEREGSLTIYFAAFIERQNAVVIAFDRRLTDRLVALEFEVL
jgi:hypothetical protein